MSNSPPQGDRRAARRLRRLSLAAAAATSALCAAAPAASQDAYREVVVFGDSISDSGSYAALAPKGAGKFTTNPSLVWVEHIALRLGLDLASHAAGGSNHAEGGARVAVTRPESPPGVTRTPVTKQIDRHLAKSPFFAPDSLVIIQGGGNDVFATQSNGLDFTDADLKVLDVAAHDLAAQVGRLRDAGAKTIITTSVPKFEVFNTRYEAALAAADLNVLYVDVAALIAEIEASPSTYGIVNTKDPACRGRFVQSFDCLPSDYVTPDAHLTYLYADGVHFTGVVHAMQADLVLATLRAPAQVSQLPYLAQADARAQAAVVTRHLAQGRPMPGQWRVFGAYELEEFDIDGAPHRPRLRADGERLAVGADLGLGGSASLGGVLSVSSGNGDLGFASSPFDVRSAGLGLFARRTFGPVEARVTAGYQKTDFDDVTRAMVLGTTRREEVGDTAAKVLSLGLEAQGEVGRGPLRLRPLAGLRYEKVTVDAYAEAGDRSSQMRFDRQTVETLTASLGGELSLQTAWGLRPYVRASYDIDLLDQDRWITVTPNGAPVPFTTAAYAPGRAHVTYEGGVDVALGDRSQVALGVRGLAGDEDLARTTGFVGVRLSF